MSLVVTGWMRASALAWLLCALFAVQAQAAEDGITDHDILIGMSAPFKGTSADLGRELYRGAMACFLDVNANGGVHGRMIHVRAYDDGYQPQRTVTNTLQLLQTDHAFLLFGYVGTDAVERTLPILQKLQSTLLFFPLTGAEVQRRPPYDALAFNLRASYRQETAGLVDHLVAVGHKRIAIFYQADAYGRSGWAGIQDALAKHELPIVGEATYARGARYSDAFDRQVTILAAAHPDVIISIGAHAATAGFIRAARRAGLNVLIANISFNSGSSMLALLKASSTEDGRDYTQALINTAVVPAINHVELRAVREYRALIDRYNPQPPFELAVSGEPTERYSAIGLEGFLDARLLVEILQRLGEHPTRAGLAAAAAGIHGLDLGAGFTTSFTQGRNQASDRIYYNATVGGQFQMIDDWGQFAVHGAK